MVELLVLFHNILDRIINGGLPVKNTNPAIPTRNKDTPTHTVLPRKKTSKPNKVNETIEKLKCISSLENICKSTS
jgi:hypothetical protein